MFLLCRHRCRIERIMASNESFTKPFYTKESWCALPASWQNQYRSLSTQHISQEMSFAMNVVTNTNRIVTRWQWLWSLEDETKPKRKRVLNHKPVIVVVPQSKWRVVQQKKRIDSGLYVAHLVHHRLYSIE